MLTLFRVIQLIYSDSTHIHGPSPNITPGHGTSITSSLPSMKFSRDTTIPFVSSSSGGGHTQTIYPPRFISCKQFWLWLSHLFISKIVDLPPHKQSPTLLTNLLSLDSSPKWRSDEPTTTTSDSTHPTQLIHQLSIHTDRGLDLRLSPGVLGQHHPTLQIRITFPVGQHTRPGHLAPPRGITNFPTTSRHYRPHPY